MVRVERCPSCDAFVPVPDDVVSGHIRCPRCQTVVELDGEAEEARGRYSDSPARAPRRGRYREDDEDDDHDEPWLRKLGPDRRRAASKVQGPAILLMISGVVLILGAIGAAVGAVFAWQFETGEDRIILTIIATLAGLVCLICGPLIFFAGLRMRELRTYGLAMAATIIIMVVGGLACQPLILVGIWPLAVLMDQEVKASFDRRRAD